MRLNNIPIWCLLLIIATTSCAKIKKPQAEIEHENWISGFSDSIAYYRSLSESINTTLEDINSQISNKLQNFELIKNPREVSGYYLLKGWNKKVPLTSTGLYVRINENEKLELIATLAGSTFNQIAVKTGGEEYYSEVVPHDQAFNYRHERYNTVYFSGGKTDTIIECIAAHHFDKVNLEFIEGGKKRNFQLPEDEKSMVFQTWDLYDLQNRAHILQKELWINSRKIETFRRMMDRHDKLEQ